MPERYVDENVQGWVDLGRATGQYAAEVGPVTILAPNIGLLSTMAGPGVCVLDPYGLADPLLARRPAAPGSRTGHLQRVAPDGYLEGRGVLNLLPDWERRLYALDPGLRTDTHPLVACALWSDPAAERAWHAVRRITSGRLLDADRLRDLPQFARCLLPGVACGGDAASQPPP
jgi:hypothetical protein